MPKCESKVSWDKRYASYERDCLKAMRLPEDEKRARFEELDREGQRLMDERPDLKPSTDLRSRIISNIEDEVGVLGADLIIQWTSRRRHIREMQLRHISDWQDWLEAGAINSPPDLGMSDVLRELKMELVAKGDTKAKSNVSVDIACNTVSIDQQDYGVEPHQAQMLNELLEAAHEREWWVSGPQMLELPACKGKKIDREIKRLKKKVPPLSGLIKSGKNGYRLDRI